MSDDLATAKQDSCATTPFWYRVFYFLVLLMLNTIQQLILKIWSSFPFLLENGDEAYSESRMILKSLKYWLKIKGGIINKQGVGQLYMAL